MCMREQGFMWSGLVSIYMYVYMYVTVDLPLETLAVDILSNL